MISFKSCPKCIDYEAVSVILAPKSIQTSSDVAILIEDEGTQTENGTFLAFFSSNQDRVFSTNISWTLCQRSLFHILTIYPGLQHRFTH